MLELKDILRWVPYELWPRWLSRFIVTSASSNPKMDMTSTRFYRVTIAIMEAHLCEHYRRLIHGVYSQQYELLKIAIQVLTNVVILAVWTEFMAICSTNNHGLVHQLSGPKDLINHIGSRWSLLAAKYKMRFHIWQCVEFLWKYIILARAL
jgi:hypothetical protein